MNIIKNNPFNDFNLKENKILISQFSNQIRIKTQKDLSFKQTIKERILNEDVPTKKEIKLFYSELNDLDKLMAAFILETGVRKNELLQLTVKMIDNLKMSESGNFYILQLNSHDVQIKNNKSRNIILTVNLRNKIKEYLRSEQYQKNQLKYISKNNNDIKDSLIFISNRGTKFSPDKLNKSFKKACEKTCYDIRNVGYIKPHVLRHCFASYYIKEQSTAGKGIETAYMYIAERLGHSNMETTKLVRINNE